MITWTTENIAKLKKLYPIKDNATVATELGTTERSIRSAAIKFNVKKSNRYWPKKDITTLLKDWPISTAEETATNLGRTRWAVINKYRETKGLR